MSTKLELKSHPVIDHRTQDDSYVTQMLRELAIQAKLRNMELAYFLEMAAACSQAVDEKEGRARRQSLAVSA